MNNAKLKLDCIADKINLAMAYPCDGAGICAAL